MICLVAVSTLGQFDADACFKSPGATLPVAVEPARTKVREQVTTIKKAV